MLWLICWCAAILYVNDGTDLHYMLWRRIRSALIWFKKKNPPMLNVYYTFMLETNLSKLHKWLLNAGSRWYTTTAAKLPHCQEMKEEVNTTAHLHHWWSPACVITTVQMPHYQTFSAKNTEYMCPIHTQLVSTHKGKLLPKRYNLLMFCSRFWKFDPSS